MANMTHIMVDTETTGTDPQTAGILQLSAIKFNLATREIGGMFDACPSLLPRRSWSDSTRAFWRGHKAIYDSLVAREQPARAVFQAFADFCCEDAPFGGYIFVAKPVKFDWPMVESHMIDLDIPFPFAHHAYLDVNSYMAGREGVASTREVVTDPPFPAGGLQHNALHDCAYQIDMLFAVDKAFTSMEHMQA